MGSSRYCISTEIRGNNYGKTFDDTPSLDEFPEAVISRIRIRHARLIDALEVHYTPNRRAFKHGGNGGDLSELVLKKGEIITAVEGSFTSEAICHLTFVTNKRKAGPYGEMAGQTFTWSVEKDRTRRNMALLSFSGRASQFVLSLAATFAEVPYCRSRSEMVKYERTYTIPGWGPTPDSLQAPESIQVSQFATSSCLMSPTILLSVGPDGTKFYVNEATLCRLPFFKAALQGGFKEAVDKTINMPEDNPQAVAAIIEFLYTGHYSYAYNCTEDETTGISNHVPAGTLKEGLFHVAVCATASKYDCLELREGAWKSFQSILQDTSDIDRLRLWKAAYSDGIQLLELEDSTKERSQEELRRWVGVLFKEHREEMNETMGEDQQLACDLLRLVTVKLSE